jgi:phytoene dehydrogenase-like protein
LTSVASTTNHYHLIVLGSDIAGLVAAALVARRGKRVLVLSHGPEDGTYRLGQRAFALDTAPVIHMGCPAVRRVFQELGLLHQVKREHAVVDGLIHVVLPEQRLDLQPGHDNWLTEADREWPDDAMGDAWELRDRWTKATDEILGELLAGDGVLEADGFWSRRFLNRVSAQLPEQSVDEMAPLPAEHPARLAARVAEPWLQHLTPAQLGKAASLRLAGLWLRGPEDLPAGSHRLREVLLHRIALHSGEIKREIRVADVLIRRAKVTGVTLLGKSERYGCDHLVVATDPQRLLGGPLSPDQLPRPLTNMLGAIKPAAHRYVLHVEIDERGLSPALDGMALCVPSSTSDAVEPAAAWTQRHGIGAVFVRTSPGSTENRRLLSITSIVDSPEEIEGMRERILGELDVRGVLPFVRPYLKLLHSPHDGREATDGDGEPLGDVGPGSAMRLPMYPLYELQGDPSLGLGMLPHSSGLKHLCFASRLTLPGLGLEGEFAAGYAVAGLVASANRSAFKRPALLGRA